MKVAIAGGHGQIALELERQLAAAGHRSTALIRNNAHADDIRASNSEPAVVDLEKASVDELAALLTGHDAVVFAAGSGPNSGPERKASVDRDGAILLADAARSAGVSRYVMISSMGADQSDPDSDEQFQIYLAAKGAADEALRQSGLDWTIIRPGKLTDDAPSGKVKASASTGVGEIPRADVAAVLAAVLGDDSTIGQTFELVSGNSTITEALSGLTAH